MDDDKDLPELEEVETLTEGEDEPDSPPEDETSDDADEGDADNAEGEDGDEGDADAEAQPQGRAAPRISKLANERKEALAKAKKAEAEVERLRRDMEAIQRNMNTGRSQADAAAEQELLANMDPIQRVQYEADKKIDAIRREVHQAQLTAIDTQDKSAFLSKASTDPIRLKYVDKVERALSEMRAKGVNAPRDDIYYYMLGKSFSEAKAKPGKNPAKDAARARVAAVQGKTSSVRSDASTSRKGKTAEERLEGVPL